MTVTRDKESTVAQEHVALALSLVELHNHRQSDPAWLEKCLAALAADCEVVDAASETTFHGEDGLQAAYAVSHRELP